MIKVFIFALALLCAPLVLTDDARDSRPTVEAGDSSDFKTHFPFFKRLAEQGNASAQNTLGYMYDRGIGAPQDYKEAVKWYRKAAEQGVAAAQYNLGVMHHNGRGVPEDFVQAHMWYNLAAALGNKISTMNRDIVAEKITRKQIAEAQRLAREWMEKHKYSRPPSDHRHGIDTGVMRQLFGK